MPKLREFFIQPLERDGEKQLPRSVYLFNAFLLLAGMGALFYYMFTAVEYDFQWESVYAYRQKFTDGFLNTLYISAAALVLSLLIGLFLAYAQNSRVIMLRFFARFYIELIRGTPLLVQILIFFYVFATNLGIENRYVAGVVILAMFAGAYVTEIIRAAIESIDAGQFEAAKSLGFTPFGTYRYIIFPQAFKRMLPPLTGQFASIIKDSSLLSIISINELTMNAQEVNAFTYSTLESYIPLAIGYLILTYPISHISTRLERRMKG
ncbi:amino acid ABC transporter permease [Nitratifractor sp.]